MLIREGHLAVNGVWLASPGMPTIEVIGGKTAVLNLTDGGGPLWQETVAEGTVLAIGDHRRNSLDSRFLVSFPRTTFTVVLWQSTTAAIRDLAGVNCSLPTGSSRARCRRFRLCGYARPAPGW